MRHDPARHINDYQDGLLKNKKIKPDNNYRALFVLMAERQGFEPWMEVSPHTRLAGERLQPARPSLLWVG